MKPGKKIVSRNVYREIRKKMLTRSCPAIILTTNIFQKAKSAMIEIRLINPTPSSNKPVGNNNQGSVVDVLMRIGENA